MGEIAKQALYILILQGIIITQFVYVIDLFLERQPITFKRIFYLALAFLGTYVVLLFCFKEIDSYLCINAMILSWILFRGKTLHKVFAFLFAFGINAAAESFNQILIDRFAVRNLLTDKWESLILQFGSMAVVLVLVIILKNKGFLGKNKREYAIAAQKEMIALSVLSMVSIVMVCSGMLIYTGRVQVINNRIFLSIIMVGAVILDFSLIVIMDHSIRVDYYKNLNEVVESQLNKQLTYYKRLEEINEETRAIKHDIKNHMLVMGDLLDKGETEELKKYMAEMTQTVMTSKRFIQTGNPIADAVLSEKYWIACEQQIDMSIDVQLPKLARISPADLCTILSNSIDNAIEACSRIEQQKERKIHVDGKFNKGYLMIRVVNTTPEEIIIKNNTVKTSKKDKRQHGYGLANIKNCIEKYKGEFYLDFAKGKFSLEVIISTSCV